MNENECEVTLHFKAVHSNGTCHGCYGDEKDYYCLLLGECIAHTREDGRDVIWVLKEE